MNLGGKILIGAGLLAGIAYVFRLRRTSAELETVVRAKLHQISLSGLTIRVDVTLKNPTSGSLNIKFPFVKLLYKGSTIGSSQATNQDIKIPAYGEAVIDGVFIQVPTLGLLSIGADIIKAVGGSPDGISVGVKTLTNIDLGWKTIPYEKLDTVVIKKEG